MNGRGGGAIWFGEIYSENHNTRKTLSSKKRLIFMLQIEDHFFLIMGLEGKK